MAYGLSSFKAPRKTRRGPNKGKFGPTKKTRRKAQFQLGSKRLSPKKPAQYQVNLTKPIKWRIVV